MSGTNAFRVIEIFLHHSSIDQSYYTVMKVDGSQLSRYKLDF